MAEEEQKNALDKMTDVRQLLSNISDQGITVKHFCDAMARFKQSPAFKEFCYRSSAQRIREWDVERMRAASRATAKGSD